MPPLLPLPPPLPPLPPLPPHRTRRTHPLPRARSSAEEAALLDKGFERNDKYDNTTVKDFRMQQEFGAKKFIKP